MGPFSGGAGGSVPKRLAPFQLGTERCLEDNKPGGDRHGPRQKQKAGEGEAGSHSFSEQVEDVALIPGATRSIHRVWSKDMT